MLGGSRFMWEGRALVRGQNAVAAHRIATHPAARTAAVLDRAWFLTSPTGGTWRRRCASNIRCCEGALQATADGILAVSSEGRITSYNRQFLELWRVSKEMLDANDTAALAEYILQQLSNPAAMQTRIRHFNDPSKADTFDTLEFTDGRVFERFSRPQLVDGGVVGRVWSFRDVTARHWAVASLRESEHKFKMLFEMANDAILIMNEKVFVDCNQVTESMYGVPARKSLASRRSVFRRNGRRMAGCPSKRPPS